MPMFPNMLTPGHQGRDDRFYFGGKKHLISTFLLKDLRETCLEK